MSTWTEIEHGDTVDLREVSAYQDELRERADDPDQTDPLNEDELAELAELDRFEREELPGYAECEPAMIAESYWQDYCREELWDLVMGEGGEPASERAKVYVDWPAFAEDMRSDWTPVTLEGRTYYARIH